MNGMNETIRCRLIIILERCCILQACVILVLHRLTTPVPQISHLPNFALFPLGLFLLLSSNYFHLISLSTLFLIPICYFHFPYTLFRFSCSMFPFPISKFLTLIWHIRGANESSNWSVCQPSVVSVPPFVSASSIVSRAPSIVTRAPPDIITFEPISQAIPAEAFWFKDAHLLLQIIDGVPKDTKHCNVQKRFVNKYGNIYPMWRYEWFYLEDPSWFFLLAKNTKELSWNLPTIQQV